MPNQDKVSPEVQKHLFQCNVCSTQFTVNLPPECYDVECPECSECDVEPVFAYGGLK